MSEKLQAVNSNELRDKALAALGNGQTIAMQIIDLSINQVAQGQGTIAQLEGQVKNLQQKCDILEAQARSRETTSSVVETVPVPASTTPQ